MIVKDQNRKEVKAVRIFSPSMSKGAKLFEISNQVLVLSNFLFLLLLV